MKLAILLCLVPAALGYSAGPPVTEVPSLCTDMIPTGHNNGVSMATDQANYPYTITVSASEYTPGGSLTVTITGTGGNQFEGFFIQARRVDPARDNNVAIGTFSSPPATTQLLTCHSVTNSAWGHSSSGARDSIMGTWTAPAQDEGPLEFKATIVKGVPSRAYFYTDVTSPQLAVSQQAFTGMTPTGGSGSGTTPSSGPRATVSFGPACVAVSLAAILNCRRF